MLWYFYTHVDSQKGRNGTPEGLTDLQCMSQLVCIGCQQSNIHQALGKKVFKFTCPDKVIS